MNKTEYNNLLKHPLWQKKRLEIMQRDLFTCQKCGRGINDGTPLNVHHKTYFKEKKPWEYEDYLLVTLCEDCHKQTHTNKTNKIIFYRSLLIETSLSPVEKIVMSYVLQGGYDTLTTMSKELNISYPSVLKAVKTIKAKSGIEKYKKHGYFELIHSDILCGELLIFYSYLYDKSKKYGYCIDTYKSKIAIELGKTKVAITKMLNRLYAMSLAKRLPNGELKILL